MRAIPSRAKLKQARDARCTLYPWKSIRAVGGSVMLSLMLTTGCSLIREAPPCTVAPPSEPIVEQSQPNHDAASANAPSQPLLVPPALPPLGQPQLPEPSTSEIAHSKSAVGPPLSTTHLAKSGSAPTTAPSPTQARAPVTQSSLVVAPPPKAVARAPLTVPKEQEQPLDVAALKARLRDTKAIGVFTKLALKSQVDDLLQQFKTHYLSGQTTDVAALRQPYDMLVLKVLALVQDSDPSLAHSLSGSREAIWGILADREKFSATL
jgi:hypothetical protein